MMVKNVISLANEFSIRSQINLADVSQIHTSSRETTRQWNYLIRNKSLKSQADDIVVHICPWEDEDWQQYLVLEDRVSRIVVWLSDDMELGMTPSDKIEIVRYKATDHSERFAVVAGTGIARALVSWCQPSEDTSFIGVFISSPTLSTTILDNLEQKIRSNQK